MSSAPKQTHCPQSSPPATGGRRRRTAEDDPDQRRQKFLERNRAAATRCRQKRKVWVMSLERKAEELTHTNLQLQVLTNMYCIWYVLWYKIHSNIRFLRMKWRLSGQKSLSWSKFCLHIKTVLSPCDNEKHRVSKNLFSVSLFSSHFVFHIVYQT